VFIIEGKYTQARVFADSLEPECVAQITKMANHQAFTNPIAIMPDAHTGKGSCIGFTMPLSNKLIPAVIGVDIGCGVSGICVEPSALKGQEFGHLDRRIRNEVPFGFNIHRFPMMDGFPWKIANEKWRAFVEAYSKVSKPISLPQYSEHWFIETAQRVDCSLDRALKAPGTLGGGNHFIEICEDVKEGSLWALWVFVHSGSRKFGECVAKYWQRRATCYQGEARDLLQSKKISQLKAEGRHKEIQAIIAETNRKYPVSRELNFLEAPEDVWGYMHHMLFAQQYASYSRELMLDAIEKALGNPDILQRVECVHNFIDPVDLTIRKGAIRARKGDLCLIPLNMADGTLIGIGRGNPEYNYSAPHGAGRRLSRSAAKRKLSVATFRDMMKEAGVWSSSVGQETIDEAPEAYKPVSSISSYLEETVEVVAHLKPIFNMKDKGERRHR